LGRRVPGGEDRRRDEAEVNGNKAPLYFDEGFRQKIIRRSFHRHFIGLGNPMAWKKNFTADGFSYNYIGNCIKPLSLPAVKNLPGYQISWLPMHN
jgi:hypothetical protein